jgi:GAF domain-containing protein
MLRTLWVVDDITQDVTLPPASREYLARFGQRALVYVPLRAGDRIIGFVNVYRTEAGSFSPVALQLYQTLVDQAAVALERARLLEESQAQAWREHAIREVTDQVSSSFDLDTILATTMEQLGRMMGAQGGYAELGVREKGTEG